MFFLSWRRRTVEENNNLVTFRTLSNVVSKPHYIRSQAAAIFKHEKWLTLVEKSMEQPTWLWSKQRPATRLLENPTTCPSNLSGPFLLLALGCKYPFKNMEKHRSQWFNSRGSEDLGGTAKYIVVVELCLKWFCIWTFYGTLNTKKKAIFFSTAVFY